MKKYTKRLFAFLLAFSMVVTGMPMSAKEAKAEEDVSVTLDFVRPTDGTMLSIDYSWDDTKETFSETKKDYVDGVVSTTNVIDGTEPTYGISSTHSLVSPPTLTKTQFLNHTVAIDRYSCARYITKTYSGANYVINPSKTTVSTIDGVDSVYILAGKDTAPGLEIQLWATSGENGYLQVCDGTVAFDFTVPVDGNYAVTAISATRSPSKGATVSVNDNVIGATLPGELTSGVAGQNCDMNSTVALKAGETNTVSFTADASGRAWIRSITFTKVPAAYSSATMNLVEGATFDVNSIFELSTSVVLDDGTAVSGEAISVEYNSTDKDVASITDGILSAVGVGETTITAAVSYNGEYKETISRNITVTFDGVFEVDLIDDIDMNTLSKPQNGAYFTAQTKSIAGADTAWSVNVENTTDECIYDEAAGRSDVRWFTSYLQYSLSTTNALAIDFEVPQAGKYDVAANVVLLSNGARAVVKIGENSEATIITNRDFETTDAMQAMGTVYLEAGTNTIYMSRSIGTYFAFSGFTFTLNNAPDTHTVTWDVDGVQTTETYEEGAMPVYPNGTPAKEADAQYTYTFAGWDKELAAVEADVTYTAKFDKTVNTYTIKWVDEDGTEFKTFENVEFGAATPTIENPAKEADAQYTYTFTGWTPEVATTVTGNATYTATYSSEVKKYTIKFVDEDGSEISSAEVAYGEMPEVPADPTKAGDAQYTYTFAGWDADVVAVIGNATYTATYASTVNEYEITFVDEDGTEISKATYVYGEVPTCEAPSKAEDVYATYTFAGWSPEVVAVEGKATYTATYTATPKTYTVTWVVNGAETQETYEAGKMPVAPAVENYGDAQYTYVFTGWDKEFAEVTADVTYTAQFEQTVNKYTVTWLNHNGETILAEEVAYGETPVAPTATYKEYTFLDWDKEVVAVTEAATYTAVYDIDGIDEGYYYADGKVKGNAGVVQIGEDLYFVCYSGKIAAGQNMTVPANKTNDLVEAGTYYFFDNGVMENPADDLLGYIGEDGYYYVKGEVRKNVGLVEIDGLYYYVHYSGKVAKGTNQTVPATKLNNYEVEAGTYYFYANGVMATAAVKASGEVRTDGYYYVYDELTKNVGLVELANGDFIYVHYSGKVVQNGYQTVTEAKANGHTEYVGVRKFIDGVMLK